jgi:hypothetical protein
MIDSVSEWLIKKIKQSNSWKVGWTSEQVGDSIK